MNILYKTRVIFFSAPWKLDEKHQQCLQCGQVILRTAGHVGATVATMIHPSFSPSLLSTFTFSSSLVSSLSFYIAYCLSDSWTLALSLSILWHPRAQGDLCPKDVDTCVCVCVYVLGGGWVHVRRKVSVGRCVSVVSLCVYVGMKVIEVKFQDCVKLHTCSVSLLWCLTSLRKDRWLIIFIIVFLSTGKDTHTYIYTHTHRNQLSLIPSTR